MSRSSLRGSPEKLGPNWEASKIYEHLENSLLEHRVRKPGPFTSPSNSQPLPGLDVGKDEHYQAAVLTVPLTGFAGADRALSVFQTPRFPLLCDGDACACSYNNHLSFVNAFSPHFILLSSLSIYF